MSPGCVQYSTTTRHSSGSSHCLAGTSFGCSHRSNASVSKSYKLESDCPNAEKPYLSQA